MNKQTLHTIGVSQTRITCPTPDGCVEAIASVHLDATTGQWYSSIRLSPPARQEGYLENQLTALQQVVNEAVAETDSLLASRLRPS